jgi:protein CrcB
MGDVLGLWVVDRFGAGFPLHTLVINATGSLAVGVLLVLLTERFVVDPAWRLFLVVGFLGGYTTFSSYTVEALVLAEEGEWLAAASWGATGWGWPPPTWASCWRGPSRGRGMPVDEFIGPGVRVRVYFGERDHHGHQPLWAALLELLRAEGAAGATVLRGVAGFGAHSRIHTARLVDLSSELPLVLEWVDTEERVAALLPRVTALLEGTGGLLTTDPVEVHRYVPHRGEGRRGAE